MSSHAEHYTVYQVANSNLRTYPFPHILVHDVFAADLYRQMLDNLLPAETMQPIKGVRPVGKAYSDERFVFPLLPDTVKSLPEKQAAFWTQLAQWLLAAPLAQTLMHKFGPYMDERFKGKGPQQFYNESMLVDDRTRYSLGPHSDAPAKVITVLFYLAADERRPHLGTSIYAPRDPSFRCPGGPHHPFDRFERIVTMPYLPNTMFAFFKTDDSFHGVEPITDADCRRHLLFYDLKCRPVAEAPRPETPKPAAAPGPKQTFTF